MRLLSLILVLMMLGVSASGCVRRPEVALQNVELSHLGPGGGSLLVTLEVTNPNSFALDSERMTYALELEGLGEDGEEQWLEFVSGTYDAPFSVPAGQSATVQLPVDFDYTRLGSSALALLRSGGVDYRARGTVLLHTPLGTRSVPFKKQGTLGSK
jgi:LEA14-like dessication related protein